MTLPTHSFNPPGRTCSLGEAAELLGQPSDVLLGLVEDGTIPAFLEPGAEGGEEYRVPVSAITRAKRLSEVLTGGAERTPTLDSAVSNLLAASDLERLRLELEHTRAMCDLLREELEDIKSTLRGSESGQRELRRLLLLALHDRLPAAFAAADAVSSTAIAPPAPLPVPVAPVTSPARPLAPAREPLRNKIMRALGLNPKPRLSSGFQRGSGESACIVSPERQR